MRDISGEERERERNTNLSYRIHHSAAVVLAIWSCVNYYGTSYTFFNHHSSTQTPQDSSTGSQDAAVRPRCGVRPVLPCPAVRHVQQHNMWA
ncbi:hypothetical protein E2C01_010423 [Portunus trituberculatus]|uniref:Uncharacterized protein n=1 Tax=Portunus trituberculatus TaxID=210409 RepID=A0A5B7D8E1_PORTR|nr:hypothetical protein [Portunus trituberculatus]